MTPGTYWLIPQCAIAVCEIVMFVSELIMYILQVRHYSNPGGTCGHRCTTLFTTSKVIVETALIFCVLE